MQDGEENTPFALTRSVVGSPGIGNERGCHLSIWGLLGTSICFLLCIPEQPLRGDFGFVRSHVAALGISL